MNALNCLWSPNHWQMWPLSTLGCGLKSITAKIMSLLISKYVFPLNHIHKSFSSVYLTWMQHGPTPHYRALQKSWVRHSLAIVANVFKALPTESDEVETVSWQPEAHTTGLGLQWSPPCLHYKGKEHATRCR